MLRELFIEILNWKISYMMGSRLKSWNFNWPKKSKKEKN